MDIQCVTVDNTRVFRVTKIYEALKLYTFRNYTLTHIKHPLTATIFKKKIDMNDAKTEEKTLLQKYSFDRLS